MDAPYLMRIAFISEHFNPGLGGAEVYLRDFSHWLCAQGHQVDIITQSQPRPELLRPGLQIHTIAPGKLVSQIRWLQWIQFARAAKERTRSGYDVVLGTGKCIGANVFQPHGGVTKASQRQNSLLVGGVSMRLKTAFNQLSPKHLAARWIENQQFAVPGCRFIAISQMVKNHMQEFHGLPDDRIDLIYNGVDLERFRPAAADERLAARRELGLAEDVPVLAVVAHNFRLKGLRELIEALPLVRQHQQKFVIVVAGAGRSKPYLAQAKDLGCSDNLRFLGSLKHPEKLYAAADAYLQPTWYDPCSLVVLESLASGLPTLTTSFNGAGELIKDGETGYVISSPAAISELASRIVELLDPQQRAAIASRAREAVLQHSLEDNYREMLASFSKAKG